MKADWLDFRCFFGSFAAFGCFFSEKKDAKGRWGKEMWSVPRGFLQIHKDKVCRRGLCRWDLAELSPYNTSISYIRTFYGNGDSLPMAPMGL